MWFSRIEISIYFFRDTSAPSLKVNYNFPATWFYGKTAFIFAQVKNYSIYTS